MMITITYRFVKNPQHAPRPDTIQGTVLAGIRKLKTGTIDQVLTEAKKAGLAKHTNQDQREQTRVHLARLRQAGAVEKLNGTPAKIAAHSAPKPKPAVAKAKPRRRKKGGK